MRPFVAAVTAVAGIGGLAAAGFGLVRTPDDSAAPRGATLARRLRQLRGATPAARRSRRRLAAAGAFGLLVWLVTGWLLAVLLIPAAVWGLPVLLQTSSAKADIARLEAMSDWAQNLATVLGVGVGIEQAVAGSLLTAPEKIRPEIARLAARLQARWDTEAALRAFADDLDDATGDLLAAALILGARRRGDQLSSVLDGLATAVRDDVRVRRTVDAEQARGRTTARLVTAISAGGLGLMLLTPYADPYRAGSGQLLLIGLLTGYIGCLVWMRRITATPRQPRILVADGVP
ncbi:type II secretion system F family protein [Jiangella alkaliphila]|uniref:Flp pilus assembly protein TadB n=1 Tax=Jiangella alkaliphila TaxID=419479 RepID=A0A1H2H707_9ACTN|nr:type II secretion system F family protein [Jiangella alkaliphila]SDU27593.1 Flp pilus assembly protein TadB [Jiangella alkaliphila]